MQIEPYYVKLLAYFPKAFAAMMGAVLSLILSGDIDKEGKLTFNYGVLMKFTSSVTFALYGGEAFIEHFDLTHHSVMYQGFILLVFGIFGMLVIGILYQGLALLRGKPLSDIVSEVRQAFLSIFGANK